MSEIANYLEVQRALDEQAPAILEQIPARAVQLSLPLDGRGARICARVAAGERAKVPAHVAVRIDGRALTIPVETATDYQAYEAY